MNKETLQDIFYFPLYLYFKIHAMLPLPVLYILADILYLPLILYSKIPAKTGFPKYEKLISRKKHK